MKRLLILVVSALLVGASLVLPVPDGLTREAFCALLLMVANIACWIGDVAPKSVVGIIVLIMLPIMGIAPSINDALANFVNSILFFLLAASALSAAVKKSTIPQRIMSFFLKISGRSTRLIVLAFMATGAIVSSVMTDLAACILIAAIALPLFNDGSERFKNNPGFVKCIMIGIPAAALAGGTATPIGSASNITMMGLLETSIGLEISWARWMSVGIPISIISLFASWFIMCAFLRPKPFGEDEFASLQKLYSKTEKMSAFDIKTVLLISILLVLWVLSDVLSLNTTIVALAGMAVAFLPGVNLLTWDDFKEEAPWDLLIMLGCLFSLASYLISTGAIQWISDTVLASVTLLPPYFFLLAICAMVAILRAFIPQGAPVVTMLTPMLVALAQGLGIDPFAIVILMSIWAQITYLMPPCDALYLVTYQTGFYSIKDVLRFGFPLTIGLLLLYCGIVPILVGLSAAL